MLIFLRLGEYKEVMFQPTTAFDATVLKHVATEVRHIKAEYSGVVSDESIDLAANQSLHDLAGSRVPQLVPLFVGRFTRKRLQELRGFRRRGGLSLLAK